MSWYVGLGAIEKTWAIGALEPDKTPQTYEETVSIIIESEIGLIDKQYYVELVSVVAETLFTISDEIRLPTPIIEIVLNVFNNIEIDLETLNICDIDTKGNSIEDINQQYNNEEEKVKVDKDIKGNSEEYNENNNNKDWIGVIGT